jgi:hypothetical protein
MQKRVVKEELARTRWQMDLLKTAVERAEERLRELEDM